MAKRQTVGSAIRRVTDKKNSVKKPKEVTVQQTINVTINIQNVQPEKKGFNFQGLLSMVSAFIRFITWL